MVRRRGTRAAIERRALREAAVAARADVVADDSVGHATDFRELLGGRWTVIDRFERRGSRYLVASAHPRGAVGRISPVEGRAVALAALGRANKVIAGELGVAVSTAAEHVSSALRKLGIRSRVELIGLLCGARVDG